MTNHISSPIELPENREIFEYDIPSLVQRNAYDSDSDDSDDDESTLDNECFGFYDDDSISTHPEDLEFDSLDEFIEGSLHEQNAMHNHWIRGHSKTKRRKVDNLKPIAFVCLNSRLGKPKPIMIRALLDSGGSECLLASEFASKLRVKTSNTKPVKWSTPGGELTTNQSVKAHFTLPEFYPDKIIEWDLHVTKDLGAYDMIIGRDLLEFLQIDLRFSTQEIVWEEATVPFRGSETTAETSYHIDEPESIQQSTKRILDADYTKADLEEVCKEQIHLSEEEQEKLYNLLLSKYEDLFDGTLGKWTGTEADIELQDNVRPYHAKPFPVPRIHLETFKKEIERLCDIGVLKRVNRSEWAAPTFLIPKKDGTVRFISDFRELNKRIRRKPYPIPKIQEMLLNLEGFQYATSLDLNMGYYHIELTPFSKRLCTIVTPFGKFEYQRIPMGLCNSPDIFQEKMSELMMGLEFARVYLDDLMSITKGDYDDHLNKLELILKRIQEAGLKINAKKSFFARGELEYLGYWVTREGIQPLKKKVEAIMKIAEPKTRRQLRGFIGIINFYRDMWIRRSHILAPLASLTSNSKPFKWEEEHSKAFKLAKQVIARHTMLAYPNFSKPFQIHTDASHHQLGAVISQEGKPIAFYSRKLNPAQTRYTTTERELLSIVETLKEYRNILLGHEIEVFTDHKNLVYKSFNTERVMRWRLLLEEFGPKLTYIKGANNVVADALSRMEMTNEDFGMEAFALDDADFPEHYPLTYRQIRYEQQKDQELIAKLQTDPDKYKYEAFKFADNSYDIITKGGKIYLPKPLQKVAAEWYHSMLMHPGETRLELSIGQHYTWLGLRKVCQQVCKACKVCRLNKKSTRNLGKIPPKDPELIPWHTLCIDLVGPYKIGPKPKKKKKGAKKPKLDDEDDVEYDLTLWCMTFIDPATGWFDLCEIKNKQADWIANYLEFTWLTRYPWPTEVIMDRGREFAAEVRDMLNNEYGRKIKLTTARNPQANSMVERAHQTMHNMIRSAGIRKKTDLDPDTGWTGILSSVRRAMNATVHTTLRASPAQLVFGRDSLINVSFEADWDYIRERKQKRILHNNNRENKTRIPHTYQVGDKVTIREQHSRKHGNDVNKGPYTVTQVNDNGTVRLTQVANRGGAVSQTWNIRNLDPYTA